MNTPHTYLTCRQSFKSEMSGFWLGQSDWQILDGQCNDGRATMRHHRMLIRLLFIELMSGC